MTDANTKNPRISVDSQHSSDGSMSSSSIIVMPHAASQGPSPTTAPATPATQVPAISASGASTLIMSDDDNISESGSDASSISLISMPSSEDEDAAVWEDSRSQTSAERAAQAGAMDYVLLYDENSSSEE